MASEQNTKRRGLIWRFRHWLLETPLPFVMVWLLVQVLNLLPLRLARAFGRLGGWFAYYLDLSHRGTCLDNLLLAFPDKTPLERRRILQQSYRHLGVCLVDFCRFTRLTPEKIKRDWVVPEDGGLERVQAAMGKGRGMLAIGAHIGFWELSGFVFPVYGIPVASIGRKIASPRLDAYINSIRALTGSEIVHQEGALRTLLRTLKEGKAVGVIMDQHAGRDHPQVPFFGRDASTVDTVAKLHLKTGAPMTCNVLLRRADDKYVWRSRNIDITLPENETDEQLVRRILTAINREFEDAIRSAPEQWLWMHRRWRVSKTGAISAADADVVYEQSERA